jgi:hypothetical protein
MSMERFVKAIKQAGTGAVAAGSPVHVMYGEALVVNPVTIRVDQRFTLTAEFLTLTAATEELKVTIEGVDYLIRPGLQVGDKVVLLRVQGGQHYVVLDKVVES